MSAKKTAAPSIDGTPAAEILRRLEISVTRRLDGLLQGDHRGLTPGHGSEPGEIRAYQPGDDVRRIDWNVTARLGETHVKRGSLWMRLHRLRSERQSAKNATSLSLALPQPVSLRLEPATESER